MCLLIAAGADINAQHGNPDCPLAEAAFRGHSTIVRQLLEHGADVNVNAALSRAAQIGNEDLVELLLSHGAHISNSALSAVAKNGHVGTAQKLLNAGAKANPDVFVQGLWGGSLERVQLLIRNGAGVNSTVEAGSALEIAAEAGNVAIVQELLKSGARPDANCLYAAARKGDNDIVFMLLGKGLDINAEGRAGTALVGAAREDRRKTIKVLLNMGADVNQTGGYYGTVPHYKQRSLSGTKRLYPFYFKQVPIQISRAGFLAMPYEPQSKQTKA